MGLYLTISLKTTLCLLTCFLLAIQQFWESELRGEMTAAKKMEQGGRQWVHLVTQTTLATHAKNMVCQLLRGMCHCVCVCVMLHLIILCKIYLVLALPAFHTGGSPGPPLLLNVVHDGVYLILFPHLLAEEGFLAP